MKQRTTIAVSGVVGSGKSSTAKAVVEALRALGQPAEHVRFQEFADLFGRRRSSRRSRATDRTADGSTASAGIPRWMNYRRRHLSPAIALGYALRTMIFRVRVARRPPGTVLVFDRYFYDSLVHYDVQSGRLLRRWLTRTIPRPSVAALLLIDEATLLARRPLYSAEYAREVRRAYGELPATIPNLLVLHSDHGESAQSVAGRIVGALRAPGDARAT